MSGVLRIILNIYVGCICHSICFVACMGSPQSRCRHKATSIYWWVPVVVMGSNIMFVLLCSGQNTNRCKYSLESINRLWRMAVNLENTLVLFTFPFLLNMENGSMFSHWGWMIHKHQKTNPSLVEIMACLLLSAKPLPEPMIYFCWLDPEEQTSVKFL